MEIETKWIFVQKGHNVIDDNDWFEFGMLSIRNIL